MFTDSRIGFAVLCLIFSCRSHQGAPTPSPDAGTAKRSSELVYVPIEGDVPSPPRIFGSTRNVLVTLSHDGRAAVDIRFGRIGRHLVVDATPAEGFDLLRTDVCVSDLYADDSPTTKWPPCLALHELQNPSPDERLSVWVPVEPFAGVAHFEGEPIRLLVLVRVTMSERGKPEASFVGLAAPTLDLE